MYYPKSSRRDRLFDSSPRFCGLLTWEGFEISPGGLYIFTVQAPDGNPINCDEGILAWKTREWFFSSPEVVSNIHYFGLKVLQSDTIKQDELMY